MDRQVSVRELRNHTAQVVAAVWAGERVSLTVNRMPVADIVPHVEQRSPWVASATLRAIVDHLAADAALLSDLRDVREGVVDES